MLVPITGLYVALLTLTALVLQQLVGRERIRSGVSLYDGGDEALAVAIRRQGNFVELVPMALVLLAVLELNGASSLWLHGLGIILLASRIIHPFGLDMKNAMKIPRIVGAAGSFLVMLVGSGLALWQLL